MLPDHLKKQTFFLLSPRIICRVLMTMGGKKEIFARWTIMEC